MARFGFACLITIALILLVRSVPVKSETNPSDVMEQTGTVAGVTEPPALSPSQSSWSREVENEAEAPAIRRLGKHHSSDKSVAGGGVIIGGLVTAIFAAVFAYIRVTKKRDATNNGGH
ncbi:hypothetical protein K2173_018771 [Erythroxylum novogranatense]|uniref:Transmembrane protein n=1 Tax=Erythroxylum novogranatense TaxID=1862640 RepID=A0AAV8SAT9_9ROSI|nr:hypothetical protein K2173_018771 [Erythroxylum novogranatense]